MPLHRFRGRGFSERNPEQNPENPGFYVSGYILLFQHHPGAVRISVEVMWGIQAGPIRKPPRKFAGSYVLRAVEKAWGCRGDSKRPLG